MTTYKFEKDLVFYLKNFDSIQAALDYNTEVFDGEYTVTVSENQIPDISPEERLQMDISFGMSMVQEFLLDNRLLGTIPVADQLLQLGKFKDLNTILTVGAIRTSYELLLTIPVDQYFTQARKNKYLTAIDTYLLNNYG